MIYRKNYIPDLPWSADVTDIDLSTFDYSADPRVFSSPEGTILIPNPRDQDLARVAYEESDLWYVQGVYTRFADVTVSDHPELQAFDTMEAALYAVLGEPVDELPGDIDAPYDLVIEAGDDPTVITFGRDADGWHAHMSQPASTGYPAYFAGNSPLEALTNMFGLRPAGADDYEFRS